MVVGTWMKVSLFKNEPGGFMDVSEAAGLGRTTGWWNSIACADLDMDGDLDFIAGNHGRNSMLKASSEEPVELWLNDFDNNGIPDPIISTYQQGHSYPIASLDELKRQIIGIERIYTSYASYAGQTVKDIFGEESLSRSIRKQAETMESALFINQGDGTYETRTLPMELQFAPIRNILAGDFNADGIPDLMLAGNNYSTRPSLGRQDASYGWILLANEDFNYKTLWPARSGISLNGDLRKLQQIRVNGESLFICAPNNGYLQVIKQGKKDKQ